MENRTDSAVMEQVQRGDTGQLAFLFERYNVPLFQYLLHLSRNRALSEDLVQEVFFRVLKYARSYDPNLAFNVWLYRMARNAYLDLVHKQRAKLVEADLQEFRSDEPMPEEILTRKQDIAFLQAALKNLPEDKREVLVLSRFQDMRYQEIAQILNCDVGTVKVRVYRALKQLREIFSELRGEPLYDA
jgi:RNA polymerase sigma-70 factor (ECF subfamily)